MICTCTMNPSLDYYMEMDNKLKNGAVNRSSLEYYEAGGKGINVSIVLNNLQVPSRACGFLGGFTKELYIKLLERYEYVQPNFTYIDGHTRINVKVKNGTQFTTMNAAGPIITSKAFENLSKKVSRLTEGDFFVLGGVCPDYLVDETVEMLKEAIEENVRVCIDANRIVVEKMLGHKPFLVKSSAKDLMQAFGHEFDDEALIEEGLNAYNSGAQNVIFLDSTRTHAYLFCKEGVFKGALTGDNDEHSAVGIGDSVVAGFLMDYMRGASVTEAFKFGCCCGGATAFAKGLATRDRVEELNSTITIEKIR